MERAEMFCTCRDTACPNHPTNHARGCEPCIRKNLAAGEIPSCFFRRANPEVEPSGYTFADFAALVRRKPE